MKKIRLDTLLVERGLFPDAAAALRAVLAHEVKVGDAYATSAAMKVAPDAVIEVKGAKRYVSRGGFKLQGALDAFGQDVTGLRCLDVGASTGGFTDCLLQAGAAHVACVDVNYGQLAWSVRQDARTTVFERTNIKLADPAALGAPFDLIVADVSFIGLAGLAPVFARLSRPAGAQGRASVFIGLVKPQFESRHDETDHGVVRDKAVRERTVREVSAALEDAGFAVTGVVESPITGPEGNVEYLVRAVYSEGDTGQTHSRQEDPMESKYLNLLGHRYSCRKYSEAQLTDEQLSIILEAARKSPSARNSQPTRLCVVQDPEGLAKIDECTKCRYGAPTVIIVAYDHDASSHPTPDHGPETCDFGDIDASIALTNMDNAAASLGLGSCWVGAFDPRAVRERFNVPESYRLVELFMVGHAAAEPGANHTNRHAIDDFVVRESF